MTGRVLICGRRLPPAAALRLHNRFDVGRDCAALSPSPSAPSIWKKKKKLFVSKESTAAILSRLGIRISIEHYFLFLDAEHPNRGLTTPFSGKWHVYIAAKEFLAKNPGFNRRSSDTKPSYIWFPLQSGACVRISLRAGIVYRTLLGDRQRRGDYFAEISHFYATVHFYTEPDDFCREKIDVRKWIECRCKINDARARGFLWIFYLGFNVEFAERRRFLSVI